MKGRVAGLGGTLCFLGPGDPNHLLDPTSAYHVRRGQVQRAITRQLFAYPAVQDVSDPHQAFRPAPDVAVEIPSEANGGLSADRLDYTIRLRGGVWWNSRPTRELVAQDFVRGLKRLANPAVSGDARGYFTSTIRGMVGYCDAYDESFGAQLPRADVLAQFHNSHDVTGLRAIDDRTLLISLEKPANDFLNILAMGFAAAVPEEYDASLPGSLELRPTVSGGPYRIAGCTAAEMVLERNPVWRPETDPVRRQEVDAVHIRRDAETDVVRGWIDSGEIDLAWQFGVVSWGKPDPDFDASFPRSYPGYTLNPYLVFNLQSPNRRGAMQDIRVRRAITYAIDKVAIGAIVDALEGVATVPLHSVITPGSVGHRGFNPYPTPGDRGNLAKAQELLRDAGYHEGLTLIAAVRNVHLHLRVMRSVAADLRKCGIELDIRMYQPEQYYQSLLFDPDKGKAGVWDIAEPGWTPDWHGNNGRAVVQQLLQTNFHQGTTNYGGYSNPKVDRLIDQALQEPDLRHADERWHEVDVQVMNDVPIVPILAFACKSCAARTGATGWTLVP